MKVEAWVFGSLTIFMIIGFGFGFITLTGLLYEFYRGDHAH